MSRFIKVLISLLLVAVPVLMIGKEIQRRTTTRVIDRTEGDPVHKIYRLKNPLKIDADWDKPEWKRIKSIKIGKYMGEVPKFRPTVEAKMMYDDENVYVIFRVKDRFVRSIVQEYNGNVSGDSCVEFFFSPDPNFPSRYFNLEVNAGGTPLIFYVVQPFSDYKKLLPDEIREIEIAHSLPEKVDPEITDPVTWTIEYRLPLSILNKYSNVTRPGPGVIWKANFYKTGSLTSDPNYITWAFVDYPQPNFHLPEFFGTIEFQ
jgi:hypothetical protein